MSNQTQKGCEETGTGFEPTCAGPVDTVSAGATAPAASQPRTLAILCTLLLAHSGMLAWGASRQSPTLDEPAHLAAGMTHWQLGRFDLYRVNPPFPRMIAALPLLFAGAKTDLHNYSCVPGIGHTFEVGKDFVAANGERTLWLVVFARWACIPFSLVGALACFLWAKKMFGPRAGLLAAALWCFSPNILAHGQLVTPDIAAAAFGLASTYVFWNWLRQPTWLGAIAAGLLLGVAELTKTTLLLFFLLWPLLWAVYRLSRTDKRFALVWMREIGMIVILQAVAVYVINAGYGFDGSCQTLGSFYFVSQAFAGKAVGKEAGFRVGVTGNRFADSWMANLPVPLPSDYLLGMDAQRRDFEDFGRPSYLRGKFQDSGWWYYYLYALTVKVPLGIWCLTSIAACTTFRNCLGGLSPGSPPSDSQIATHETRPKEDWISWRDHVVLLLPPAAILIVVSSQTGFSHHFRYLLPAFPFVFVWISQIGQSFGAKKSVASVLAVCAFAWAVASSLAAYPHSLSYFNELAGGPRNGHNHLINSNIDWGQDLWELKRWLKENQGNKPLRMAYDCYLDAAALGLKFSLPPRSSDNDRRAITLSPALYAVSVNFLKGYPFGLSTGAGDMAYAHRDDFSYFQTLKPIAMAGYSIYIYEIDVPTVVPSKCDGRSRSP